jgi:hypothetical protein
VDNGGLTVHSILIGFAIPLFDRRLHHSSVLTMFRTAAARRFCPGRPNGRREAASPWTDASTAACSFAVGGLNRILWEDIASFGERRRRQVMLDRGGQDKSADGCRAHVVGWRGIFVNSDHRSAGSSPEYAMTSTLPEPAASETAAQIT